MIDILDMISGWANMSRSELIATSGAAFGFLGGVILAFAASSELVAHRLMISALELEVMTVRDALNDPQSPIIIVNGGKRHMDAGVKSSKVRTSVGIVCLLLSLALTMAAFFVG